MKNHFIIINFILFSSFSLIAQNDFSFPIEAVVYNESLLMKSMNFSPRVTSQIPSNDKKRFKILNKLYFDITGLEMPLKLYIPGGTSMLAGDISLGYKISEVSGIGLSWGGGGEFVTHYPNWYTGISLQGRWRFNKFTTTIDIGKILDYSIGFSDLYPEDFERAPYPFFKIKETIRIWKVLSLGISLHYCTSVITKVYELNTIKEGRSGDWYGFSLFLGVNFN